jgi:hypothetical protein
MTITESIKPLHDHTQLEVYMERHNYMVRRFASVFLAVALLGSSATLPLGASAKGDKETAGVTWCKRCK